MRKQMKKIKYVLIVILILSAIVILVLHISPKKNNNFYDLSDLKNNERERVEELYSGGKISKGELFDIKFSYYNSPNDYELFIIKKVDGYIEDLTIRVDSIINGNQKEVMSEFPLNKPFQEFQDEAKYPHIWSATPNGLIFNDMEDVLDMSNLIIYLCYYEGEEVHYLNASDI